MTAEPTTISATPAAVTPPAEATTPTTTPTVDAEALRRENEALKNSAAEHQRTAQFWYEKASKGETAPKAKTEEPEPEIDVLDLATKGGKAFEKYLGDWAKKNGYVRGSEMTAAIEHKTSELTEQTKLIGEYPELKNDKSEFFQATAQEYGTLKNQGVSEQLAMRMAAERVELRFLREGKTKTPAQAAADAKAQRETDRRARAAAGAGEGSGRTPADAEDDDTLSVDDERAVQQLADGLDIPLDEARTRYIKRAKAGVRVALKLDRRGR
jgi:hypothetical protein